MNKPVVWTIAGCDSSGGAGIFTDMLTFSHLNVHGCSVITAATAQNSKTILANNVLSANQVESQLNALVLSTQPSAIKIGMIGSVDNIAVIEKFLEYYGGKVVLDPVMISTTGNNLFEVDKQKYIQHLTTLFPYIDLLTPNLSEAEALLNRKIQTDEETEIAAQEILSLGVKNVIIKGHHDYFTNGSQSFWLSSKRYEEKNYRGTGCVFSSAIAASLASGYTMDDAIIIAKMVVTRGIRLARHETKDTAYLYHGSLPDELSDLPMLASVPLKNISSHFPSCGEKPLGLYPIVDSSALLEKLLPLGVSTIQLRIKNKRDSELENEIKAAIYLANQHNARLFINDHWELAIQHGAYGVHLGQEDLHTADIQRIHAAGLRLGISTHCFHEVARAHAIRPSYYACGPIFETNSKAMSFAPQGLDNLSYWRRVLKHHPLVAIGGIHPGNMADVVKTGVDGIAMISTITKADHPEKITLELLEMMS